MAHWTWKQSPMSNVGFYIFINYKTMTQQCSLLYKRSVHSYTNYTYRSCYKCINMQVHKLSDNLPKTYLTSDCINIFIHKIGNVLYLFMMTLCNEILPHKPLRGEPVIVMFTNVSSSVTWSVDVALAVSLGIP